MSATIQIKLFATLGKYLPDSAENFRIEPGISVQELVLELGIPTESAKLIFINGEKAGLSSKLAGGERVGIFPPVGGG